MKALLIDLDGVLYQGDTPLPGAAECVSWLREHGIPHLFLTNTSSIPRRAVRDKLAGMGIEVETSSILTPVVAAARWIRTRNAIPVAPFLPAATAGDLGNLPLLEADGTAGAGSVVLGDLGEAWDFPTLNRAFNLLMESPEAPLVALGMTRYWRAEEGLRLDVGPFVRALEYATGREAVVTGKPAAAFFRQALSLLGAGAEETHMVGDDIVGDVNGAQAAGLKGVLVKTGKFRPEDLAGRPTPNAVLDSVADLRAWWEKNRP